MKPDGKATLDVTKKDSTKNSQSTKEREAARMKIEKLYFRFLPLIRKIVRQMIKKYPRNVEYDDVYASAIFGFIDAVRKFDESKNCRFEYYAAMRIRGAVLDGLRKDDYLSRNMRDKLKAVRKAERDYIQKYDKKPKAKVLAKKCGLKLVKLREVLDKSSFVCVPDPEKISSKEVIYGDYQEGNPFLELTKARTRDQVKKLVATLDCLYRDIVEMHYFSDISLDEVAEKLNIDRTRIYYLRKKALKKMRERCEEFGLEMDMAA